MAHKIERMDDIPVYEFIFDEDDPKAGVKTISLVTEPATEIKGMYFNKFGGVEELQRIEFSAIKEQKKIVGPAMVPNKRIYRKFDPEDENSAGYYGVFSADTILRMMRKFNKNNNNRSINIDHSNKLIPGYIEQNYIINDPVYNNAKSYGYNLIPGTWFMEIKIEDDKFWREEVKENGKYSFSIEAILEQEPYKMALEIDYLHFIKNLETQTILSDQEIISILKSI
jgi:hypothetical protein